MDLIQLSQAGALIAVSFILLPLSSFILLFSYVYQVPTYLNSSRRLLRRHPAFRPKTILVTGAGTASGLRISRALYEAGHNVVGADFEPDRVPTYARFSTVFRKFYTLRSPNKDYDAWLYIQDLVRVVQFEKVALWINCSNRISPSQDAQARQVLEDKTQCISFAPDNTSASYFATRASFLDFTKSLGLPTPELHPVKSRGEIHDVLNSSHGKKKYILNMPTRANSRAVMLPRRTLSQTYSQVSKINITKDAPLVLEQHFDGLETYSTFAVIVRGDLVAFAASATTDSASSYRALPTTTGVGRAMLQFMQAFAARAGERFTTHLSVEFRLQEKDTDLGFESTVLPVSCQTQPALPSLLFSDTDGSLDLAKAYLSVLDPTSNGASPQSSNTSDTAIDQLATPSLHSPGIYFIGPDILTLILRPLLHLFKLEINPLDLLRSVIMFANHVLFWREGTFASWDPLPLFVLNHIFLPVHLVLSMFGSDGGVIVMQ